MGKYSPPVLFSPLLSAGKLKTGWIPMSSIISISTQLWANSRWDDTVCNCRRAKIIRDENNPVHSYALLCKVHTGVSCSSNEAEPITLILTGCIQTDDGVLDNHLQHIYWDNEHCMKYRKLKKLSIRSLTSNSKILNCWTTFNKNKESSLNSCVVFLASNGP